MYIDKHRISVPVRSQNRPYNRFQNNNRVVTSSIFVILPKVNRENWDNNFEQIPDNLLTIERDNWFNDNAIGYLASDGFFPFRDNIDISSRYNVKYIIQPGGSIADPEIINVCNIYGITMVFSGARLFYH